MFYDFHFDLTVKFTGYLIDRKNTNELAVYVERLNG